MTETGIATQTYCLYVHASSDRVWDAIVNPDVTDRYGYRGRVDYELHGGGAFRAYSSDEMRAFGAPDVIVDGEVLEAELPRRLVQTWKPHFGPEIEVEPATRLTWTVDEEVAGVTRLTLTHELDGAPLTAAVVSGSVPGAGGGWAFVLSDLKTLLETGSPLPAADIAAEGC